MIEGLPHPLEVAVDARLEAGSSGGIQQYVLGLAAGLSSLGDGDESYRFLGDPRGQAWLLPYLAAHSGFIEPQAGGATGGPSRGTSVRHAIGARIPWARRAWGGIRRIARPAPVTVASSDGTLERSGVDLVHFPFQGAFTTAVPSIYQPWDLQHVHLPAFFTDAERRWRDAAYGAFCAQASLVVVASAWARDDVSRNLGVPRSKIAVIDVPPVVQVYPVPDASDMDRTRARHNLPPRFAYYPAQTWPHKNHVRLLEAMALLRDREGIRIDLVCSGSQNSHYPTIQAAVRRLRLDSQVRFIGFVDPIEVQALYRLARLLIFPSLFEGWGLPVVEAFAVGLPVACSSVTSLPELVGDAGLLFDPEDPQAIGASIARLWDDDGLCATLASRGRVVAGRFDWAETARTLRAHYRAIAGRRLDATDQARITQTMAGLS